MSDNCCTFAPEIGKEMYSALQPVSVTGNAGVRPVRNSRLKNTYRRCAEEKERSPSDFGLLSFSFIFDA